MQQVVMSKVPPVTSRACYEQTEACLPGFDAEHRGSLQ